MNVIKNRTYFYIAVLILAGAFFVLLILRLIDPVQRSGSTNLTHLLAGVAVLTAGLSLRENFRWKAAQLIAENQILHIFASRNLTAGYGGDRGSVDIEVYISCFGILINDKVIKFNQDRIRLKSVDLDSDSIVLTYGSLKRSRSVRLLHEKMTEEELVRISDQFRYETGVIPSIIR